MNTADNLNSDHSIEPLVETFLHFCIYFLNVLQSRSIIAIDLNKNKLVLALSSPLRHVNIYLQLLEGYSSLLFQHASTLNDQNSLLLPWNLRLHLECLTEENKSV